MRPPPRQPPSTAAAVERDGARDVWTKDRARGREPEETPAVETHQNRSERQLRPPSILRNSETSST
jgi:hypothetical protein